MPSEDQELITIANPKSPVSEAYRTLRTNIQFSSLDKPLRTLLVTSSSPSEGKSTTVGNLGVTFAQAGYQVILVDCDLRRPSLHEIFSLENDVGLTSLAIGELPPTMPARDTSIPNLRVLPSGPLPPNPSELLGSQRMEKIIEILRSEADFVLFDCAPVLAVTDAAVLARKVDGVVMVVSAGKTKREHAAKAKVLLEKVSANILGVALNNAKFDSTLYRY